MTFHDLFILEIQITTYLLWNFEITLIEFESCSFVKGGTNIMYAKIRRKTKEKKILTMILKPIIP